MSYISIVVGYITITAPGTITSDSECASWRREVAATVGSRVPLTVGVRIWAETEKWYETRSLQDAEACRLDHSVYARVPGTVVASDYGAYDGPGKAMDALWNMRTTDLAALLAHGQDWSTWSARLAPWFTIELEPGITTTAEPDFVHGDGSVTKRAAFNVPAWYARQHMPAAKRAA